MLRFIKHVYEGIEGVEIYPIISLVLFVTFMVGVCIYVFFLMDKKHVSRMKKIPLGIGLLLMSTSAFAADSGDVILIEEDFLFSLNILTGLLVVIVTLLALIALMVVVKDPGKISWKSLMRHFTGEDSKDPMMDHSYDGIQELDNPIPAWLAAIFYGTVVFAIAYMLIYHVFEWAPLQDEEYANEIALADMTFKDVELPDDAIIYMTDEASLAAGKEIWMGNCIACHGALGEGGIGPNMTDAYWIHGNTIKDIYRTVTNGVPQKGMISWSDQLTSNQRLEVSSFIKTLEGTNPPNPKEAEGVLASEEVDVVSDTTVTTDTLSIPENGEIE